MRHRPFKCLAYVSKVRTASINTAITLSLMTYLPLLYSTISIKWTGNTECLKLFLSLLKNNLVTYFLLAPSTQFFPVTPSTQLPLLGPQHLRTNARKLFFLFISSSENNRNFVIRRYSINCSFATPGITCTMPNEWCLPCLCYVSMPLCLRLKQRYQPIVSMINWYELTNRSPHY